MSIPPVACAYCPEDTVMVPHCSLEACSWTRCLSCKRLTVVKLQEILCR